MYALIALGKTSEAEKISSKMPLEDEKNKLFNDFLLRV